MVLTMMKILITRPRKEAEKTAELVSAQGFQPLIDPLLTIHFRPEAMAEFTAAMASPVDKVVITSINGAHALAQITTRRDLPLLAVGEATAEVLRSHGFAQITVGTGDVASLKQMLPPGNHLYISGDIITQPLEQAQRIVAYRAEASTSLREETWHLLRGKEAAMALFFSARTAAIFAQLTTGCDLSHMTALVISPKVAAILAELSWREVLTASSPQQLLPLLAQQARSLS